MEKNESDSIRVGATVIETLPNAMFRLELSSGEIVTAHIATELRMKIVRIVPGDRVTVELARYDLRRGRIVERS